MNIRNLKQIQATHLMSDKLSSKIWSIYIIFVSWKKVLMRKFWSKLQNLLKSKSFKSERMIARAIEMPSSTFNDQVRAQRKRNQYAESAYWESQAGQNFLRRLVGSTLYTFGIKSGIGASRIEEFFEHIRLYTHIGISQSSILRIIKQIELSILKYQLLQEQDLQASQAYGEELKVVLGLDETWIDEMLLVCQDLTSGYLFLKQAQLDEIQPLGGPISKKN